MLNSKFEFLISKNKRFERNSSSVGSGLRANAKQNKKKKKNEEKQEKEKEGRNNVNPCPVRLYLSWNAGSSLLVSSIDTLISKTPTKLLFY